MPLLLPSSAAAGLGSGRVTPRAPAPLRGLLLRLRLPLCGTLDRHARVCDVAPCGGSPVARGVLGRCSRGALALARRDIFARRACVVQARCLNCVARARYRSDAHGRRRLAADAAVAVDARGLRRAVVGANEAGHHNITAKKVIGRLHFTIARRETRGAATIVIAVNDLVIVAMPVGLVTAGLPLQRQVPERLHAALIAKHGFAGAGDGTIALCWLPRCLEARTVARMASDDLGVPGARPSPEKSEMPELPRCNCKRPRRPSVTRGVGTPCPFRCCSSSSRLVKSALHMSDAHWTSNFNSLDNEVEVAMNRL